MSLERRLDKLEKRDARASSPGRFWGPPRTDTARRARLDAGRTRASDPHCFWAPGPAPSQPTNGKDAN